MASIYSDEERELRYMRLRKLKKKYEGIRGFCMWGSLFCGIFAAVPSLFVGMMTGLFLGRLKPFFIAILIIAAAAFAVYAVYQRDIRIDILAIAVLAVAGGAIMSDPNLELVVGCVTAIEILIVVKLIVDYLWKKKLEPEEGYPDFDITWQERKENMAMGEKRIKRRALEAGIRVKNETPSDASEMADLLDEGTDRPLLEADLKGYHDRSRAVDAAAQAVQVNVGEMDEL